MKIVCAPDVPGSFDKSPFLRHMGDVTTASAKDPATEIIEVNPQVAQHTGGRVALVFSVYSAVGNGAVSVASLKPVMRMEYGGQVVECAFDFTNTKAAKDPAVYTYVIGTAIIDGDSIRARSVGALPPNQAARVRRWLTWDGSGREDQS